MDDNSDLENMPLGFDDPNGVNAMTLTTLLNSGVEEALSSLSPAQLVQLGKNVQKRTKQFATPASGKKRRESGGGGGSGSSSAKRKYDDEENEEELQASRSSGGQYLNLPASTPMTRVRDGVEWLIFTYSTKGVIQEYMIRIDIDNVSSDDIPEDFKSENCVYPRALCAREDYIGNRWEYETACNELAWRLTWINAGLLSAKRGLIQRAVDSFRNRFEGSRSRRVVRQEKLSTGTLRRRTLDQDEIASAGPRVNPKMLTFQWNNKGALSKCRIRIDIENANVDEMDETFKRNNCIYARAMTDRESISESRWEYENEYNELAWKLAWLNATKLSGKKVMLQKAVDAYRARFEDSAKIKRYRGLDSGSFEGVDFDDEGLELDHKSEEFSEMVANTLQQALSHHDLSREQMASLEEHLAQHELNADDLHPRTVSTAELLSNLGG